MLVDEFVMNQASLESECFGGSYKAKSSDGRFVRYSVRIPVNVLNVQCKGPTPTCACASGMPTCCSMKLVTIPRNLKVLQMWVQTSLHWLFLCPPTSLMTSLASFKLWCRGETGEVCFQTPSHLPSSAV